MISFPTNQPKKTGSLNASTIILIIVFAVLVAVTVLMLCYVMDWQPMASWVNQFFVMITNALSNINLGGIPNQIYNYFTADPVKGLTTIVSITGACGTLYGLYRNWKQTQLNNQLQQQALEAQVAANNQIYQLQTQAQQEAAKYQTQITGYQNQISQYTDIQSQLNQLTTQKESLESQLQAKANTITELSNLLEQWKLKTYTITQVK
jgi:hypothetical protein